MLKMRQKDMDEIIAFVVNETYNVGYAEALQEIRDELPKFTSPEEVTKMVIEALKEEGLYTF